MPFMERRTKKEYFTEKRQSYWIRSGFSSRTPYSMSRHHIIEKPNGQKMANKNQCQDSSANKKMAIIKSSDKLVGTYRRIPQFENFNKRDLVQSGRVPTRDHRISWSDQDISGDILTQLNTKPT